MLLQLLSFRVSLVLSLQCVLTAGPSFSSGYLPFPVFLICPSCSLVYFSLAHIPCSLSSFPFFLLSPSFFFHLLFPFFAFMMMDETILVLYLDKYLLYPIAENQSFACSLNQTIDLLLSYGT
jgi:hypothetical protein